MKKDTVRGVKIMLRNNSMELLNWTQNESTTHNWLDNI